MRISAPDVCAVGKSGEMKCCHSRPPLGQTSSVQSSTLLTATAALRSDIQMCQERTQSRLHAQKAAWDRDQAQTCLQRQRASVGPPQGRRLVPATGQGRQGQCPVPGKLQACLPSWSAGFPSLWAAIPKGIWGFRRNQGSLWLKEPRALSLFLHKPTDQPCPAHAGWPTRGGGHCAAMPPTTAGVQGWLRGL